MSSRPPARKGLSKDRQFDDIQSPRSAFQSAETAFAKAIDAQEKKQAILEDASFLERNHLFRRAAKLLLDAQMIPEAEDLGRRLLKEAGLDAAYAAALISIKLGDAEGASRCSDRLSAHGPKGLYYAGLLLSGRDPDRSRIIADMLSGKEPENAQATKGSEEKALFKIGSPGDISDFVRGMSSFLSWHVSCGSQRMYYSLRLYQSIGDEQEARRCLSELKKDSLKSARNLNFLSMGFGHWMARER